MLSNKNREKYTHNGYCYVKDRDSADGHLIFWRCDERGNGCKGRIWTTSCQNHYNTNPEFALNSRMIVSLAFVPQNDLLEALNMLENYLPLELEPILAYFTNTYIGRIRNNGTRAPPTF
uniref:FLYWCH-type domain-containing protein n=1 Tax=Meloidogyne enterolobii TaxID=390850 RepID=A0A6V7VDU4_MELEN|nr:unnamed protein product [Meloidogyne enterolobii]